MTKPQLTDDQIRRLAFIRLLLDRAVEMSSQAPPFSFDSINRLHDAAEMYLALAVEVHHVGIPGEFMSYWAALAPAIGRPLGYKAQMQRFNKVRVNLKHYGVEPSANEIASAATGVSALLTDECPHLFGCNLDEVAVTRFIGDEEAREFLDEAEEAWSQGDLVIAMGKLGEGFDALIKNYEQRKMMGYNKSVFDNSVSMTFLTPFSRGVQDMKQRQFEDAIIKSLNELDFALMIVGLGVDLRRYGRFKSLVPSVTRFVGGRVQYWQSDGRPMPTQSDFDFCRDFVVATAIHLDDFDYDLDFAPSTGGTALEARQYRPGKPVDTDGSKEQPAID